MNVPDFCECLEPKTLKKTYILLKPRRQFFFFGKLIQSLVLVGISETYFNDFYSCALQPEELCIQTYAVGERLNKIKFFILLVDKICIIWNCLDQVVRKFNVLF